MPDPQTTERATIRMRVAPDATLRGYVFLDEAHARLWLSAPWVDPSKVELERVLVGVSCSCARCGGTGRTQSVKKVADVSLREVLGQ